MRAVQAPWMSRFDGGTDRTWRVAGTPADIAESSGKASADYSYPVAATRTVANIAQSGWAGTPSP